MNKYIKVLVFLIVFMVMIFPIINVNADVKKGLAREVVINNLTSGDTYDDGVDTFITGEDPNNYIWYRFSSGTTLPFLMCFCRYLCKRIY